jgi:polysaccharide deacetylase family protein (PEP-CTERM system associated)
VHHALTFDVEDWFHLDGIPAVEARELWPALPSLVEERTNDFLRMCESAGVCATFFILGWVAERCPRLVPRIRDAGHEIASHSFWHRRIPVQTREEFVRDLLDSVDVLESQGATVVGYRAPCFSLSNEDAWIFDELVRAGFRYDSSQLAGCGGTAPRGPHVVRTSAGRTIAELPVSRIGVGPFRARFSGGGYLRILPLAVVEAGLRSERRAGRPTVVYLHPRDLAPDCPRVAMPAVRKIRTYARLNTTRRKLTELMRRHAFAPCGTVLDEVLDERPVVTAS